MGIKRTELPFEGNFTQIPNQWVRDVRLTRRARGLLAELLSHRIGWHISIKTLTAQGKEGRDAVRASIAELAKFGYLKRAQGRSEGGKFGETEYELATPETVVVFSGDGEFNRDGLSDVGFAVDGLPDVGESAPKNTSYSEDQITKNTIRSEDVHLPDAQPLVSNIYSHDFEVWWFYYPRKQGKKPAYELWPDALRRCEFRALVFQTIRFREDVEYEEQKHVTMPAKWLADERWDDEYDSQIRDNGECLEPEHEGYMVPCAKCEREKAA